MEVSSKEGFALLEQLKQRYGYDFTGYSPASIIRRINRFAKLRHHKNEFELRHGLLNNQYLFQEFVNEITVNVTEFYRDPDFYASLAENVFPFLRTYPYFKIWHAGCSSGEEVYSLAILFKEYGLLPQAKIYATDINQNVLHSARKAMFPATHIAAAQEAYERSGGKNRLEQHFTTSGIVATLAAEVRQQPVFSQHNLVTDHSFNEFNLIICRNVLIYFAPALQERVISLFYESLAPFGYLALGNKENLLLTRYHKKFEVVDRKQKIYRKLI